MFLCYRAITLNNYNASEKKKKRRENMKCSCELDFNIWFDGLVWT